MNLQSFYIINSSDIQMKKLLLILIAAVIFIINCSMLRPKEETGIPDKTVILTFDDGPNARQDITEKLVEVLNKCNVQGAFCFIGKIAEEHPEIVRFVYESSHIIVNHSYSHGHPASLNTEEQWQSLVECDKIFGRIIGIENYKSKYYRPPYGIISKNLLNKLKENNIKLVPANFYVNDAVTSPDESDELFKELIAKTEEEQGGIILLHEFLYLRHPPSETEYYNNESRHNRSYLPEFVEKLIIELEERGYRFGTLDELDL